MKYFLHKWKTSNTAIVVVRAGEEGIQGNVGSHLVN